MRGILAVAFLVLVAMLAQAQFAKDDVKQRPGTARVAVVNIGVVFNKYEKAQEFKQALENTLKPFKARAAKLTQESKEWKKTIDGGDLQEDVEQKLKAAILGNQRELEDMDRDVKQLLGKKQEQNLVTLWKEVQDGIRSYASEQGIELVLAYGDPMNKATLDLYPNVNRKMQAMDTGSTVPLYMAPRVEIGDAVATRLNRQFRAQKAKERADSE